MVASSTFLKRIIASENFVESGARWEQLIVSLLRRLELEASDRRDAEREYMALADAIASRLEIPRHSVDVYPQGSMRSQTTIRPRGTAKFDLDIIVELSGPRYLNPDAEVMFAEFGRSLEGNEAVTGTPRPRRRAWTLPFPNKAFYFDVTPAVPDLSKAYGACLRVRDPDTTWSPSNPKEFAEWFCELAKLEFSFQVLAASDRMFEARKSVTPLPSEPVRIDDILRRTVQLVKLHRDNFYHYADEKQKEAAPISVIIVTLASRGYEQLWATRREAFTSPIEVVLAIVEDMPRWIERDEKGQYLVKNPKLPSENFADRWNKDQGVRAREFYRWHGELENHLEALLTEEYSRSTEGQLMSVFGQAGVDAWKGSLGITAETSPLLKSLVAAPAIHVGNPTAPTPVGRNTNTLA
jgi:hypothetical protein